MRLGGVLLFSLLALSACGAQAAPPPSTAPTEAAGPAPAPTDLPTQTPQPTDTPVPTNTVPPTPTRAPDTPTPLPTNTPAPTATRTPVPVTYPANPFERLAALRTYRLQLDVNADGLASNLVVDEATPNYHATTSGSLSPPLDVYFVNGRYVSSLAGLPFVDTGGSPPLGAGVLEAAEQFAQGWFDHPDSAVFKARESANGVQANHFVLTWKAGRAVSLGAISSTTYDPTTGDVWLDIASGAIVKAAFTMRVNNGGGVSPVVCQMDLLNINRPLTITPPAAGRAGG
jgi:hypothetical protein